MAILSILKRIVPEAYDLLEKRYLILKAIHAMGPVGRRTVAHTVDLSERTARNEMDKLRSWGLITGDNSGMRLTEEGGHLLKELEEHLRDIHGLALLEGELALRLGLRQCIIVPGDSDTNPAVKQDIAQATARYLRSVFKEGDIIAVTGGSTVSQVADSFHPDGLKRNITVVPARGGLGEDVNLQANSIAARLAQHIGGRYKLLHAPDYVRPGFMENIMNEPRIREVINAVRRSNILLHGIGTAEEMARRRGYDDDRIMQLIADGAVGEAFGYFFNAHGEIVYNSSSVGLRLEDLGPIPLVIAIGGGKSKAWAVMSVLSTGYCDVCITDEGAARRLMSLSSSKSIKFKGGKQNDNENRN